MSKHLRLDPAKRVPLLKVQDEGKESIPASPPHSADNTQQGDSSDGQQTHASIRFIGTATTIIEWQGVRVLTDPNFLHAGDHVHLGPGVTSKRLTNPAMDLHELPPIDCILLSHYHEDHFDRLVEASLTRRFPIITTPHAMDCLVSSSREVEDQFTNVTSLEPFETALLRMGSAESEGKGGHSLPALKVTGTPGQHIPPGPLALANDYLKAVPPTNGWLVEFGVVDDAAADSLSHVGYRMYISGDTVYYDDLKEIPKSLGGKTVDLMLIHLGGTMIPGPSAPLVMVTMDAKQGIQLMRLIRPDTTIPIHFDDYDIMLSPLSDFKDLVAGSEFRDRVVYLDRGEKYDFQVRPREGSMPRRT